MPRVTDNLRNAQILADFSNLEWDKDKVEYFRKNFAEFAPQRWWDEQFADGKLKQWQVTQAYLTDWWSSRFKDDISFLTKLLGSIFDPDPVTGFAKLSEQVVRQMHPHGLPEDVTIEFPRRMITSRSDLREGYIPMQGAIFYLFSNPWRARFCAECNKRFVAAEPKNKFCSDRCSHENRNRQKREWFQKHGKQWRRKRMKAGNR